MVAVTVLSERTVEAHVRSILAKLGFSRRTEIATWSLRDPRLCGGKLYAVTDWMIRCELCSFEQCPCRRIEENTGHVPRRAGPRYP
jgi:hypothetical protein